MMTFVKIKRSKIIDIVKNSLNLRELIQLCKNNLCNEKNVSNDGKSFLLKWESQFRGITNGFHKRLIWEGLSDDDLELLFKSKPDIIELPKWVAIIESLIKKLVDNKNFNTDNLSQYNNDIDEIFQNIYYSITDFAFSNYLKDQSNTFFSDNAIKSIKSDLINRLNLIMYPSLSYYITDFLNNKHNFNETAPIERNHSTFLYWFYYDGFFLLICKLPMLARLIGESILNWVNDYSLLIERFHDDLSELSDILKTGIKSLVIENIVSGLSDLHGGKTVKHIYFSTGVSIIYKPKNIDIDRAYYSFSSWINDKFKKKTLLPLKTICKQEYGWVEYLQYSPINNSSELPEFYYNAGVFLCVAHVLKITDCHYENLIANSIYLTLIDCETVMHPQVQQSDEFVTNRFLNHSFLQSIFRTGFLPNWTSHLNNDTTLDISALGGFRQADFKPNQPISEQKISNIFRKFISNKNQPLINNFVNLDDYIPQLVSGFSDCYRVLLVNRNELLDENKKIIQSFKDLQTRFIYRSTEVYDKVIKNALLSENLKSGIAFSISLDILSRSHLIENYKSDLWKLYIHENNSVLKIDIPIFYIKTTSTDILLNDASIPFFEKSGYELSKETIINLSDDDLNYQLNILQGTIKASNIIPKHSIELNIIKENFPHNFDTDIDKIDEINFATQIGDVLLNRKISGSDYNWLTMSLNSKSGRYQFGTLGYNLYDGLSGIALFYSALFKATSNNKYADIVTNILKPIISAYQLGNKSEIHMLNKYMGLGICEGVGSIIYSLCLISEYTTNQELLSIASEISLSLTEELITSDEQLDIISGCSGLILSLIKLYNITNDSLIKNQLKTYGDFLCMSLYSKYFNGSNKLMTGFSHGAAGYSYSLFRLYEIINDENYFDTAIECVLYERNLLDKNNFKYKDFRFDNNKTFSNAWCHGAAGIVLSRVAHRKYLNLFESEYSEIENGIKHLVINNNINGDHLCCGNSGICDIILSMGLMLNNKDLIHIANQKMAKIIQSSNSTIGYKFGNNIPKNFSNIGFFQGLSGIGYQILRCSNPKEFKSVLLFE